MPFDTPMGFGGWLTEVTGFGLLRFHMAVFWHLALGNYTDTMRMAAAWLDGGLRLEGLRFTGGHGAFPNLRVNPLIATGATPGWADANGQFEDPRPSTYPALGHLPKDWTHYKGLYRHGDEVVFHYTVGSTKVLEHPSLIQSGTTKAISRLLELAT